MKKLIIFIAALISTQFTYSQSKVNYYTSIGASYSNTYGSIGTEAGIYTDKTWLAVGFDYSPSEQYISAKFYYKLVRDNKLAVYQYNAFKSRLNDGMLFYEPGFAFVYDLFENWSPQLTVSAPISERGYVGISYGLGLNYWIPRKK